MLNVTVLLFWAQRKTRIVDMLSLIITMFTCINLVNIY